MAHKAHSEHHNAAMVGHNPMRCTKLTMRASDRSES
jgi:hypothetical protein